jgi:hypothetical protein
MPSGTSVELAGLSQTLARRIGLFLERRGLLERDAENSYLAGDDLEAGPMERLLGSDDQRKPMEAESLSARRCCSPILL